MEDKNPKNKKPSQEYMKYAGLATSLFFSMFIMYWLGSKLDAYFGNETTYIGLAFLLLTLGAVLYKLIKDLS